MMYAFSIDYVTRFGTNTIRGFLEAENEQAAQDKLWERLGRDFACRPRVYPIETDFFVFN